MAKRLYIENADKPAEMLGENRVTLTPEEILEAAQVTETKPTDESAVEEKKVNFITAWCLPNVFIYASAFFFSKFAVYAIMYNLPSFLKDEYHYDSN